MDAIWFLIVVAIIAAAAYYYYCNRVQKEPKDAGSDLSPLAGGSMGLADAVRNHYGSEISGGQVGLAQVYRNAARL